MSSFAKGKAVTTPFSFVRGHAPGGRSNAPSAWPSGVEV